MEEGPPDAIFGLVEAFNKDSRPTKVNLAIGAYRDSDGKPFVLPTVIKVGSLLDRSQGHYKGVLANCMQPPNDERMIHTHIHTVTG